MRTLCDSCESAAAILFCAADEASLCRACDEKVHMCNKLASRHVRVQLAVPSAVPRCDICENAPAFFYCEIDGTSLCLQCDMIVHVGGKRTHGRYLLLRQRVEFPRDKPGCLEDPTSQNCDKSKVMAEPNKSKLREEQNHGFSPVPLTETGAVGNGKLENKFIDLNSGPRKMNGLAPSNQDMDVNGSNQESAGIVPVESCKKEPEDCAMA